MSDMHCSYDRIKTHTNICYGNDEKGKYFGGIKIEIRIQHNFYRIFGVIYTRQEKEFEERKSFSIHVKMSWKFWLVFHLL